MKHKLNCISVDIVECDDCNKRFCRGCDRESETDFDEGVIRCGLCNALNKRWDKSSEEKKK